MNLRRLKIFVTRWPAVLIVAPLLAVLWLLRNVGWKLGNVLDFVELNLSLCTTYVSEKITAWENDTPEHTMETLRKEYTKDNL